MTLVLLTALNWAAFLAYFGYRRARDRVLNYKAGADVRAMVVQVAEMVLSDESATDVARRYADVLLSIIFRRDLRQEIAAKGTPSHEVTFPSEQLGRHAETMRMAVKMTAFLIVLETRQGNAVRKIWLDLDRMRAISQPINVSEESVHYPPVFIQDAVAGLGKTRSGRLLESAIEGRVEDCFA